MSENLVGDLFRWKNVTSQSTNDLADNWFASHEPKTVAKSLRANALEYDEMGKKALSSSFILRDDLKLMHAHI